ncbi:hypothetical protein LSAT2_025550 [Lamellibrachia satsuma]|nr:hypothetical protein LSAT2_025550 [Lamellibrachia satsuma]
MPTREATDQGGQQRETTDHRGQQVETTDQGGQRRGTMDQGGQQRETEDQGINERDYGPHREVNEEMLQTGRSSKIDYGLGSFTNAESESRRQTVCSGVNGAGPGPVKQD